MGIDKDSLGFLVADVSRLLRTAFQRRLGNDGLTFLQARALVYISRHEGVRQNQLAELRRKLEGRLPSIAGVKLQTGDAEWFPLIRSCQCVSPVRAATQVAMPKSEMT